MENQSLLGKFQISAWFINECSEFFLHTDTIFFLLRKSCQNLVQVKKNLQLPVFEAELWLVTFRGTIEGKTGKTLVLPSSCEIEHGDSSSGAPSLMVVLPSSNSLQFSAALLTLTMFELKSNSSINLNLGLASTRNAKLQIAKAL